MSKAKILITGSSGFIGRAFLQAINPELAHVSVVSREPLTLPFPNVEHVFIHDITRPFKIEGHFNFVFHLAACNFTHVDVVSQSQYWDVNVRGTEHVLSGISMDQLVLMSTAKVYANQGVVLTEESPLGPVDYYAQSKLEAEQLCRSRRSQRDIFILRPTNIAGEGQPEKALIPVFFKRALCQQPLQITVSSQTRIQFLYVQDVIDVFLKIVGMPNAAGTYNIAPKTAMTVEEIARYIVHRCSSKSEITYSKKTNPSFSPVMASKAEAILHWKAVVSLEDILERCYHYYKNIYGS